MNKCEICGIEYERKYDLNIDVFYIQHPETLCPKSLERTNEYTKAQIASHG